MAFRPVRTQSRLAHFHVRADNRRLHKTEPTRALRRHSSPRVRRRKATKKPKPNNKNQHHRRPKMVASRSLSRSARCFLAVLSLSAVVVALLLGVSSAPRTSRRRRWRRRRRRKRERRATRPSAAEFGRRLAATTQTRPQLARTRPDSPGRHLGPGPALRRRRRRRRLSFACSTTRWRWRRVRRCLLTQKKEKNGSTCSSRVIGHRWNVATGSLPFRFVLFFLYVFFCRREIRAASIWLATTMSSKRFHFNQTFSIESFLRHRLGFPALPKNFIFFCFHKNLASLVCFFLFLVLELNNTASVSNGNLRDAALT